MILRFLITIFGPTIMAAIQYRICTSLVTAEELSKSKQRRLLLWGATGALATSLCIQMLVRKCSWPVLQDHAARMLYEGALVAPISEEFAKSLPLLLLYICAAVKGRRTFLAAGMICGIGFFWSETLLSLLGAEGARAWTENLVGRNFLRGFNHAFFTGFCGLGFGVASISQSRSIKALALSAGFLLGTLVHSINNMIGVAGMFGLAQQSVAAANQLFIFSALFYVMLYLFARRRLKR